jgi:hypothetical protein
MICGFIARPRVTSKINCGAVAATYKKPPAARPATN